MKEILTVIPVVAVALRDDDGRILMQRRVIGSEHAGLWEFPGGKVEPQESLEFALIREITEELGVILEPSAMVPVSFASDGLTKEAGQSSYVILLYTCCSWAGDIQPRLGQEFNWFTPQQLLSLEMPPLDIPLAKALISMKKPLAKI